MVKVTEGTGQPPNMSVAAGGVAPNSWSSADDGFAVGFPYHGNSVT